MKQNFLFCTFLPGIVKYLQEEENKEVRYGAVVMGGLTGFIFGLRGGFFRVCHMLSIVITFFKVIVVM